jgi:hypothetical protein
VAAAVAERPPFPRSFPLLDEALAERAQDAGRRTVTSCLRDRYGGEKIVASMGALAPYMHELSVAGIDIADFIHEGNGTIWTLATSATPAAHAGWMLVGRQEHDALARRVLAEQPLLNGMSLACEGGGLRLYRADWVGTAPPGSASASVRNHEGVP